MNTYLVRTTIIGGHCSIRVQATDKAHALEVAQMRITSLIADRKWPANAAQWAELRAQGLAVPVSARKAPTGARIGWTA